jgi:hypothetical protein
VFSFIITQIIYRVITTPQNTCFINRVPFIFTNLFQILNIHVSLYCRHCRHINAHIENIARLYVRCYHILYVYHIASPKFRCSSKRLFYLWDMFFFCYIIVKNWSNVSERISCIPDVIYMSYFILTRAQNQQEKTY